MWYSLSNTGNIIICQEASANISIFIALIQTLQLIIPYHVYTYTTIFSILKKMRPLRMAHTLLQELIKMHNIA